MSITKDLMLKNNTLAMQRILTAIRKERQIRLAAEYKKNKDKFLFNMFGYEAKDLFDQLTSGHR